MTEKQLRAAHHAKLEWELSEVARVLRNRGIAAAHAEACALGYYEHAAVLLLEVAQTKLDAEAKQ